jgi:hypothetical protein
LLASLADERHVKMRRLFPGLVKAQ